MLNRAFTDAKHKETLGRLGKPCRVIHRDVVPEGRGDLAGLRATLARLVADCAACGGAEIEFCDDLSSGALRLDFQSAILAIVRELLFNACRHSKSKKVMLGLTQDAGCICVQVQDWGVGFSPVSSKPGNRGLKGIRNLVEWMGGTVKIDSQPGVGTCVMVEVAMPSEDGQDNASRVRTPR